MTGGRVANRARFATCPETYRGMVSRRAGNEDA
ncbi:hypothetical protein ThrDRAFT_02987 [Frankia casuarinae]|nr:hypothetical protein CcI6DRAFT_03912 [Frankia sp. CcI6]EYT91371.1 hypothetical protein ThrDRAFT_02987 [Frankia casuarinae]KDA41777.1 hypothetical protein BMG523Draft_03392 [Frankia sp. BMG5.23]OAA28888.1 hypothetical protein AAY23_101852 [Frankia casuarinae]